MSNFHFCFALTIQFVILEITYKCVFPEDFPMSEKWKALKTSLYNKFTFFNPLFNAQVPV